MVTQEQIEKLRALFKVTPVEFGIVDIASFENEVRKVLEKKEMIRIKDLFQRVNDAGYRYSYRNFYRRIKNMPELEVVRCSLQSSKGGLTSVVIKNG